MQEQLITPKEAAKYEQLSYRGFMFRIERNPEKYDLVTETRETGGKPIVKIAVSSLSAGAQRRYRKEHPEEGTACPLTEAEQAKAPWYVAYSSGDYAKFCEVYAEEVRQALAELDAISAYDHYDGSDRTAEAARIAEALGIKLASFYNHRRRVNEARQYDARLTTNENGGHHYFAILALCRKPQPRNTFPGLTDETKKIIQKAFFGKHIENRQPLQALCDMAIEAIMERGLDYVPSAKQIKRYFHWLMEDPLNRAAREYQSLPLREWKNRYMVKGKNDTTHCLYLEHIQGDTHTLDFWSEITHTNGKKTAMRLQLVTWIDVRTRRIVGYELCRQSNSEIVARSILSVIYGENGGVPQHVHIDNGKDYTAQWLTGQKRNEREDDGSMRGLFKQLGIDDFSRSKPYEPWGKGIIERFFHTVRKRLSVKQESYTGTYTGKATADKIPKDIQAMLKTGQLPTMEQTAAYVAEAVSEYNASAHRGLKDMREAYITPNELMQHCERYQQAPIPKATAMILMLRPDIATVTNQGIRRFNMVYDGDGLEHYNGKKVKIRYNSWDRSKLLVTDMDSKEIICTAEPKALMQYGSKDDAAMIAGEQRKKRQLKAVRERAAELTSGEAITSPRSISSAGIENAKDGTIVAFSDDPEVQGIQRSKKHKESLFKLDEAGQRELDSLIEKYGKCAL